MIAGDVSNLGLQGSAAGRLAPMQIAFRAGCRPKAARIEQLGREIGNFAAAHLDEAQGRQELIASGLSFEIRGLDPMPPLQFASALFHFGFGAGHSFDGLEVIELKAGEHLAGGEAMLPIVRTLCGLAAAITSLPDAAAIGWLPAQTWMAPEYFRRIVESWLNGGAFPALGLTALTQDGGGLRSVGLNYFTGQELSLSAELAGDRSELAKLAVRAIDAVVSHGRVSNAVSIELMGSNFRLVPDRESRSLTLVKD